MCNLCGYSGSVACIFFLTTISMVDCGLTSAPSGFSSTHPQAAETEWAIRTT
jgi:hypothetical protein